MLAKNLTMWRMYLENFPSRTLEIRLNILLLMMSSAIQRSYPQSDKLTMTCQFISSVFVTSMVLNICMISTFNGFSSDFELMSNPQSMITKEISSS